MIIFPQLQSYAIVKLMLVIILAIICLTVLSACNAQEVTDESTLGSNNAAQTNPDKISRNSMEDVTLTDTDSENGNDEN